MYPGAGGCSHKAGVKIQLEYDLLSGEFSDVKIERGKRSDRGVWCDSNRHDTKE